MDAEVYPDPKVSEYIAGNFVPVKIHIKENPSGFHRFDVSWTPTVMVLDTDGKERYRFEGYLPAADFLAQLDFGRGRVAFAHKRWDDAAREFNSAADRDPKCEFAAQASYWAAVAHFQKTHDGTFLKEWSKKVRAEFPTTTWAKRALAYSSE
ncbi:MAG: thioredoxin fold domain-containing protein [Terriglobales bacterium]